MTECLMSALVDAHFAGSIDEARERKLRAHLNDCDRCRERYKRRLLLAKLDPHALGASERIGRPLGLRTSRSSSRPSILIGVVAVAAAAAIALFVASKPTDEGFAARGSITETAPGGVQVFRAQPGGAPTPVEGSIRRGDELAFSYENRTGRPHLLVFGVDEHGHVFWYHPAWTNPAQDPAAIPALTDGRRHELKEAISHSLDGDKLEIHTLFSDRALTVKEVERIVAGRPAPLALSVPGATDYRVSFTVAP